MKMLELIASLSLATFITGCASSTETANRATSHAQQSLTEGFGIKREYDVDFTPMWLAVHDAVSSYRLHVDSDRQSKNRSFCRMAISDRINGVNMSIWMRQISTNRFSVEVACGCQKNGSKRGDDWGRLISDGIALKLADRGHLNRYADEYKMAKERQVADELVGLRARRQALVKSGDKEALREFDLSLAKGLFDARWKLKQEIEADRYEKLQEALRSLKFGMTSEEVERRCGPADRSSFTESVNGSSLWLHYGSRALHFSNGRLQSIRWN